MIKTAVLMLLLGFLALGHASGPAKEVAKEPSYGQVDISRTRVLHGKRWTEQVGAGADFIQGMKHRPYPRPEGGGEGCVITVSPSKGRELKWLDAGAHIDLNGGSSVDVKLHPKRRGGMILYDDNSRSLATYVPGKTYVVEGHGGPEVGPFKAEVVAPPILHLLEPKLDGGPTDRSKDLKLRWNGRGSGEVYVMISASEHKYGFEHGATEVLSTKICHCVFEDDGEATIPASALSQLPKMPRGRSSLVYGPYFVITRQNVTKFKARGLSDGGTFRASSSVAGNVELK